MTTGGIIIMILSVGGVTALLTWCITRVLKGSRTTREMAHIEPIEEDEVDRR